MPDILMVIAPAVFRDEEYDVPRTVLTERGANVVTASTRKGPSTGKLGMVAEAEMDLKEASEGSWDAVIFVGGSGATVFFDDPVAHALAKRRYKEGSIVAAICIAPSTLAHAGLLDGVDATAFSSQKEDLIDHGAIWRDDPVVVTGNIVTANGPEAARGFGEEIAKLLGI